MLTSRRWILTFAPLCLFLLAGCLPAPTTGAASTGTAFYIDCAGDDAAGGHTAASAWRTITKANKATLVAGDVMMFKRGCTWTGQRFEASWTGTAAKPIIIGAYGTGALPKFRDAPTQNVRVTGAYEVVQDLDLSFNVTNKAACGQPVATVYDITFSLSANHSTVQRTTMTGAMTGAFVSSGASFNKIIDNTITGNNVMQTWGGDPEAVLGAWGVLLNGSDNEVARNYLKDNNAVCPSVGDRYPGNSVEIYEGSRNNVHHNRAYRDRVFSELGGSAAKKASDNVFAYNLFQTDIPESRFVITRGALDTAWGPVYRTSVLHNTTYQTGPRSQGVVCGSGCTTSILTLVGNVVWAEEKVLYADDVFTENHNLLWATDGAPFIQLEKPNASGGVTKLPLSTTSKLAAPVFVDPPTLNFRLKASSPAVDTGGAKGTYANDLGNLTLPQGPATEMGAYEYKPGT